jgi:hypothetical protein
VGKQNDSKRQHFDASVHIFYGKEAKMIIILKINALALVVNIEDEIESEPVIEIGGIMK